MGIGSNKKSRETFNEINITPLTDIFLVLLIIMMVIAPLLDQQGLNLAVPQLGAPPDKDKEHKVITVDIAENGNISIEGKILNKNELVLTIKDLQKEKKDGLIIQAESNAIHQNIVMVMDAARTAGIENVSLMEKTTPSQQQ
ncbi:MAG: biopolymer transporter ExbD [Cyanobacteriota bacterium]